MCRVLSDGTPARGFIDVLPWDRHLGLRPHAVPFVLHIHVTEVNGLQTCFGEVIGEDGRRLPEGNEDEASLSMLLRQTKDLGIATPSIRRRTEDALHATCAIEEVIADTEARLLALDEEQVTILPDRLHTLDVRRIVADIVAPHVEAGEVRIIEVVLKGKLLQCGKAHQSLTLEEDTVVPAVGGGVLEGVGHAVQMALRRGHLPHLVEALTEGGIVVLEGIHLFGRRRALQLVEVALHDLQLPVAKAAHRGTRAEDLIEGLPRIMHTQGTTAVGRSSILLAILTPLQKHPKLDAQGVFDLLPSHIFLVESLLVCRTKIAISEGKPTEA